MDADRINGAAETSYGRLKANYGTAVGDEPARLDGLRLEDEGRAQMLYGQAKDGVRDALDRASSYAEDAYETGRQRLEDGAVAVNASVESNPVRAILVAAAVGYLLGLAFRASRR